MNCSKTLRIWRLNLTLIVRTLIVLALQAVSEVTEKIRRLKMKTKLLKTKFYFKDFLLNRFVWFLEQIR